VKTNITYKSVYYICLYRFYD